MLLGEVDEILVTLLVDDDHRARRRLAEQLEERIVEPKPGWRFRSHLIYADTARLLEDPPASKGGAAMASAIAFAHLPVAA